MAGMDQVMGSAATWHVVATGTNAVATATRAASSEQAHFITGVEYSTSGIPAAATSVTIKDGTTVIAQFEVPATQRDPVILPFARPLRCTRGNAASAAIGALGAGIVGTVNLHGFTG